MCGPVVTKPRSAPCPEGTRGRADAGQSEKRKYYVEIGVVAFLIAPLAVLFRTLR